MCLRIRVAQIELHRIGRTYILACIQTARSEISSVSHGYCNFLPFGCWELDQTLAFKCFHRNSRLLIGCIRRRHQPWNAKCSFRTELCRAHDRIRCPKCIWLWCGHRFGYALSHTLFEQYSVTVDVLSGGGYFHICGILGTAKPPDLAVVQAALLNSSVTQ